MLECISSIFKPKPKGEIVQLTDHDRLSISAWITVIIFGAIFTSISLVNHYYFRTSAYDLGLFNNSVYDYNHFHQDRPTLLEPGGFFSTTLADHFDLLTMVVSPFGFIFGSYALLIIQVIAILAGGIGMYLFIFKVTRKHILAYFSLIHFYSI